jgi:siderophore ferric iron reductase
VTTRNYLFATNEHDVALTRLIATVASASGFMKGTPGGLLPGWYRAGSENKDFIEALVGRLSLTYPAAGQPYYAARSWNNLIWQPAYLAVIAVHLHGALPELGQMSQSRQNLDMDGYRLPPGPQFEAPLEVMIERAGRDLRALADVMLVELNEVTKLKRLPALRLLADRMLGLMVRLGQYNPELTIGDRRRFCALWLEAMGLTGQGTLEVLNLDDGRQVLITARKGCCMDYLAFPDIYCTSCPKQDDHIRIARQRDAAVAEMDPSS